MVVVKPRALVEHVVLGAGTVLLMATMSGCSGGVPNKSAPTAAVEPAAVAPTPVVLQSLPNSTLWTLNTSSITELANAASSGASLAIVDDTFGGSTGCNEYGAKITFTNGVLSVATPTRTKRGCTPEAMRREDLFLAAITGSISVSKIGRALRLQTADGTWLEFVPVAGETP